MNIAICENNTADLRRLHNCLTAIVNTSDLDAKISCFLSLALTPEAGVKR